MPWLRGSASDLCHAKHVIHFFIFMLLLFLPNNHSEKMWRHLTTKVSNSNANCNDFYFCVCELLYSQTYTWKLHSMAPLMIKTIWSVWRFDWQIRRTRYLSKCQLFRAPQQHTCLQTVVRQSCVTKESYWTGDRKKVSFDWRQSAQKVF